MKQPHPSQSSFDFMADEAPLEYRFERAPKYDHKDDGPGGGWLGWYVLLGNRRIEGHITQNRQPYAGRSVASWGYHALGPSWAGGGGPEFPREWAVEGLVRAEAHNREEREWNRKYRASLAAKGLQLPDDEAAEEA